MSQRTEVHLAVAEDEATGLTVAAEAATWARAARVEVVVAGEHEVARAILTQEVPEAWVALEDLTGLTVQIGWQDDAGDQQWSERMPASGVVRVGAPPMVGRTVRCVPSGAGWEDAEAVLVDLEALDGSWRRTWPVPDGVLEVGAPGGPLRCRWHVVYGDGSFVTTPWREVGDLVVVHVDPPGRVQLVILDGAVDREVVDRVEVELTYGGVATVVEVLEDVPIVWEQPLRDADHGVLVDVTYHLEGLGSVVRPLGRQEGHVVIPHYAPHDLRFTVVSTLVDPEVWGVAAALAWDDQEQVHAVPERSVWRWAARAVDAPAELRYRMIWHPVEGEPIVEDWQVVQSGDARVLAPHPAE